MFPINDVLDAMLLGGFLFGLLFVTGSLILGAADIGAHTDPADSGGHGSDGHGLWHNLFNISSLLAFITWFGGVGYAVRNGLAIAAWIASLAGLVGGIAGAALVGWIVRTLTRDDTSTMNPEAWNQIGVIGRVSSSVPPNGYGEIVYEQNGLRRLASARASGTGAIPRNTEVVVLRMERGVAIVEPFEDLLHEHDAMSR